MKYIYILALIVIIFICTLISKESFAIPTAVLNQIQTVDGIELNERSEPAAPDTSKDKVIGMMENSQLPETGVALGSKNVERREQSFEIEDEKCNSVKFCENLRSNMNCGYCLQDDIEGNHPFHYGDEEGSFLKRNGGKQSLCKRGADRRGSSEWIPPSVLNGDKQKEIEDEEDYIKRRYPNEQNPTRILSLNELQKKKNELGIKDTGASGCKKMRERYICSKVNDCSPMNFEMFGIKAKDICGFCADDGKAYARTDLPDNSKVYDSFKYASTTSCENIEIFGDGVNCSAYKNDRNGCISKRSLKDPSIKACAFKYNNKKVKVPITIPKPSEVKYGGGGKAVIYDKCESKWGLIRPNQCSWFEEVYPCLKSKGGGPHSEKCLESLWKQMGFVTSYRMLFSNGEGKLVNSWNGMDINRVMESMQDIYNKIYSSDYDVAKKWVKICFNMNVNDCNRAGLINDKNRNQYWKETSDPCLQKLYKYGGGRERGLANPKNQNKWGFGYIGQIIDGFTNIKEGLTQQEFWNKTKDINKNFKENTNEHEIYGSSASRWNGFLKFGKNISHRDYVNSIQRLVKLKDMSNSEAKKVPKIYDIDNWSKKKFSNSNWVDKYTATKLITGDTADYPVEETKQCWPEFARRMLVHPNVSLLNLKTLSFKRASEFHSLSYRRGYNVWEKNLRKQGESLFEGNYLITQDTYDRDTFPYWKFIEMSGLYWKKRWPQFKKLLIEYSDTEQSTYQNIVRPTDERQAAEIARSFGHTLGGNGYNFSGNYGTKGLYLYTVGKYKGRCYFGKGGNNSQKRKNISYPKSRVDMNNNQEVIIFRKNSRFYNSLPVTTNIQNALNKPYLFSYKNKDNEEMRVLFVQAYKKDKFNYYDFLKFTIKN